MKTIKYFTLSFLFLISCIACTNKDNSSSNLSFNSSYYESTSNNSFISSNTSLNNTSENSININKETLQNQYDLFILINQGNYTDSSYHYFIDVLSETYDILLNPKSQNEIDTQFYKLTNAYDNLISLDFTKLEDLYSSLKDTDGEYENELFNIFLDKLSKAESIIGDLSLTQAIIDNASNELETAYYDLFEDMEVRFRKKYLTFIDEIPEIHIDTNNVIIANKVDYVNAKIEIKNSSKYNLNPTAAGIRLRGNSTMGLPKHPYRLKFDKKTSLFGFPAVKDWTLLANFNDKSLIRNYTISMLGRSLTSMDFNPNVIFIDVYLNGKYEGLYGMQDQIESGASRIDVEGYTLDKNGKINDIGFLLEADGRAGTQVEVSGRDYFVAGLPLVLKYPQYGDKGFEDLSFYMEAYNYIKNYVNEAYKAISSINSNDNYSKFKELCDETSFIDYFLVQELSKNQDPNSNFLHRKLGGKLKMGPLWDFDLSVGNGNPGGSEGAGSDPAGWSTVRINPWYKALMKSSSFYENFRTLYMERANKNITYMINCIDDIYSAIQSAAIANFERWKQGNNFSYLSEVKFVKNFYINRSQWLYNQLDKRLLVVN